jgi:4-hydroxy-tetrahydrodipicolinate synthase
LDESLGTILTAMATPFTAAQEVDRVAFARLAEFLLASGSDGLVVAGTTGESPTLTDDEKVALFADAADVARGKGVVVAGTGSNDTAHSVALTRRAEDAGVDAVLAVTPYYNRPPERGIIAHFEAIAGATTLPVIIYNIPSRCVTNIAPETLARLAEIDNVVAVKQANPDLDETRRLRELAPGFGVYAGNDDMLLDVLELGGWGGICVASHLVGPRMKEIAACVTRGELDEARRVNAQLASLYKTLFITSNPIPLKAALNLLGHEVGGLRLPLVEATDEERDLIRAELKAQGLL